jgi:hypothetical protein
MQRTPSNQRLRHTGSNPIREPIEPARNLQPKGPNVPFPEVSPIVSHQTPSVALGHYGALNDRGEQSLRHSAAYDQQTETTVHGDVNSTEHLDVQMGHEEVPVSVRAILLPVLIQAKETFTASASPSEPRRRK